LKFATDVKTKLTIIKLEFYNSRLFTTIKSANMIDRRAVRDSDKVIYK